MFKCIYCCKFCNEVDFSDEHIWPVALGGDYLDEFWRTQRVCKRCNNLAGVHVDARFIRNFLVKVEMTFDTRAYLIPPDLPAGKYPLTYIGTLEFIPPRNNDEVELWIGPCGDLIIHFREVDADQDPSFLPYVGGDPRKNKKRNRAYLYYKSSHGFWCQIVYNSFRKNFAGLRVAVNGDPVPGDNTVCMLDRSNPTQAEDMKIVDYIIDADKNDNKILIASVQAKDSSDRFLSKIALALGHKILGDDFLETEHARNLRSAIWERDAQKRSKISIKGVGHYLSKKLKDDNTSFSWPAGWILWVMLHEKNLILSVVAPSGRIMGVSISEDSNIIEKIPSEWQQGKIWVVVPIIAKAVGPVSLDQFIAHQLGQNDNPQLRSITPANQRQINLPPC